MQKEQSLYFLRSMKRRKKANSIAFIQCINLPNILKIVNMENFKVRLFFYSATVIALVIVLASFSYTTKTSDGYKLVWSDEFNGKTVDTSNWNFEIGGHGWGNHEQEYYQTSNASIQNGNLVIEGRKEDVGSNHYT